MTRDDTTFTPLRSVLYMPSSNERALEKAKGIDADALILDLEDAVSPDAKPDARDMIATFEEAKAAGQGVVTFNGRMVEELHVRDAQRILAFAEAITSR